METGAAKGSAEDRISCHLPDGIVHRIFDFLPFKEVARSCVVSKRWKHLLYSYPCLDFTSVFDRNRIRPPDYCIDHVVRLLEKRSSDVKILRFLGPASAHALVGLMEKSVKHSVQELDLEFSTSDSFMIPHLIVDSLCLRDLRLESHEYIRDPRITLPPLEVMKNGFKSLQSLSLSGVNLSDEPSLLNLFTDPSFPSLTKLLLESCVGLKCLRIQMRGLKEFSLKYSYDMQELDMSVEKLKKLSISSTRRGRASSTRVKIDAPLLEHIIWSGNSVTKECDVGMFDSLKEAVVGLSLGRDEDIPSISNFLAGIYHCQCLTLEREFVENLSRFNGLAGFQLYVFERLTSLKVHTSLSTGDALGLVSLFQSSPFVDTIFISIEKDPFRYHHKWENDFWEGQAQSLDSFLSSLKFVKVCGFGDETKGRWSGEILSEARQRFATIIGIGCRAFDHGRCRQVSTHLQVRAIN